MQDPLQTTGTIRGETTSTIHNYHKHPCGLYTIGIYCNNISYLMENPPRLKYMATRDHGEWTSGPLHVVDTWLFGDYIIFIDVKGHVGKMSICQWNSQCYRQCFNQMVFCRTTLNVVYYNLYCMDYIKSCGLNYQGGDSSIALQSLSMIWNGLTIGLPWRIYMHVKMIWNQFSMELDLLARGGSTNEQAEIY